MRKPAILCVDDEKIILNSLKEQLKRHFGNDYAIESLESGEEALEVIEEYLEDRVDIPLVISDHIMPGIKGDEFLTKVHEMSPKTLKVMLTGQADAHAVGSAVNSAKLYRYIAKPWEHGDLTLTVKEAIRSYFQDKKLEEQNTILQAMNEELTQLNTAYERFVPREFLGFLNKRSIIDVELGDHVQRKNTIVFSDIRGFTSLSEQMTPEENFHFINSYLGRMGPIVRQYEGFIDKYIGDEIMALFPESAENAVRSAIVMLAALSCYNQGRQERGRAPIRIGIGINTGHTMLGIIGEHGRMEGTVISDAVNLASRVEGLTKTYGASILLSEYTLSAIDNPDQYNHRFLGKVQVKGKENVVSIYEVFDGDSSQVKELKLKTHADFAQGLEYYFARAFTKAAHCFQAVLEVNSDDKATLLYVDRANRFMESSPPDGWQGVEVMVNK